MAKPIRPDASSSPRPNGDNNKSKHRRRRRASPSSSSRFWSVAGIACIVGVASLVRDGAVAFVVPPPVPSTLSSSHACGAQMRLFVDDGDKSGSVSPLTNGGLSNGPTTANGSSIPNGQTKKEEPSSPPVTNGATPNNKPVPVLPNGGRITLVGAGPGDPDLLTLAAHKILTDPTALVICDRLVSPEIVNIVSGEIKVARKYPGCAEEAQEEIYRWCEEGLAQGKHVVRLKIGDPFVFGRGGEEVLRFRASCGVEPKVIPGVSAAFSAPLLGSIPVTHRGVSNQVVMCTGYGRNNTSPDLIRYHKEQTVVFLMAVGRLRTLCTKLVDLAGYPSHTPVAIVEKAGCPDQRTVVGTMETIADIAEEHEIKPPSTIVVGDVVHVLLERDEETGAEVRGLIENYAAVQQ